eukprot:MONOS_2321.1-p1 / transcript=MONOS_2321.1 / gene=MONOS_2321 / organism=Monocercomonoides_exilis_PA203 / gene_product=unspecified product / transcript_product=unspecified product / location=Mono_scaffold00047:107160-109416(-) / protein_length=477 / sequence_SO=supercontig / SO=protein_coding / is_pseudo=false
MTGEIEKISQNIENDENQQTLHDLSEALFGQQHSTEAIRTALTDFKGFKADSKFETDLKTRLKGFKQDKLKNCLKLVNQVSGGPKEEQIERLVKFLSFPIDGKVQLPAKPAKESTQETSSANQSEKTKKMRLGDEEEEEESEEGGASEEGEGEGGKKKRRTKKKKDPEAPVHPLSAFFLFGNDIREKVVAELTEKKGEKPKIAEVGSELSRRWKELDEESKKPYNEDAEKRKQKYLEEKKAYVESGKEAAWKKKMAEEEKQDDSSDGEEGGKKKKSKKLVDPNAPKHPNSVYIIFVTKMRQKVIDEMKGGDDAAHVAPKDIMTKIGELWRALSDSEKEEYQKLADEEKKKYQAELEEYNKSDKKKEWDRKMEEEEKKAKEASKKKKAEKEKGKDKAKTKSSKSSSKKEEKIVKGKVPSREMMKKKIQQYLDEDPELEQISLKQLRKRLEAEFDIPLSEHKATIEAVVTEITSADSDE